MSAISAFSVSRRTVRNSIRSRIGGSADEHTSVGEIIGRGFGPDEITDAIETVVETYLAVRLDRSEKFLDAYRRVGPAPFKEALYAGEAKAA
jgi:sulfite reductase (NADPH) hemoprotein beta-component